MSGNGPMSDPDIEVHLVETDTGAEAGDPPDEEVASPAGDGRVDPEAADLRPEDSGPPGEAGFAEAAELRPEDNGPPAEAEVPEDVVAGPQLDPVEVLRAERDDYLDSLRRVQADFENYKKRVLRQQTEHLERAAEGLVTKLLPVLDTLDLALGHVDPDGEDGKALSQVGASLVDALRKEGLERVDPLGQPFDPSEAEAVMHEPSDEEGGEGRVPEVVEVLRAGYRWRGRVIRAAMVKVKG
ncbi:MAG TPA: nucleotide exchange factor GrpE [Acidimicrobiales bacterium]|nr:nucleotide exchange factor GrpE [Acidimicrobiales bacterium]